MQKPQSLTANAIQTKYENPNQLSDSEQVILQVISHKIIEGLNKNGIKSR